MAQIHCVTSLGITLCHTQTKHTRTQMTQIHCVTPLVVIHENINIAKVPISIISSPNYYYPCFHKAKQNKKAQSFPHNALLVHIVDNFVEFAWSHSIVCIGLSSYHKQGSAVINTKPSVGVGKLSHHSVSPPPRLSVCSSVTPSLGSWNPSPLTSAYPQLTRKCRH